MRKFVLRETSKFFILMGTDKALRRQQVITILKKDDSLGGYELSDILLEDLNSYDSESFEDYLLKLKAKYSPVTTRVKLACGILGFVRFLKGFYLIMITQRKRVAKLGKHSIYQIKDTQMVPLFRTTNNVSRQVNDDELKYLNIFNRIDIHTGFYYSHTYDLTRSLQENMVRKIRKKATKENHLPESLADAYSKDIYTVAASNPTSRLDSAAGDALNLTRGEKLNERRPWDNQMMWNYFLVRDFYELLKRHKWVVPVVHGSIDFKNFTDGGNKFTLILLARRSRHFAGTRYLRRGINQEGYVANWVEVEQIVWRHSGAVTETQP